MYDSEIVDALASGALVLRDVLTVHGQTLGGSDKTFAYWTGAGNVTINVDALDGGAPISRNAIGGGTLLEVPAIVDAIGLEARAVVFGLDHIGKAADSPMDMVFGHNVRVARVELHRAIFDPATRHIVGSAHLLFAGRVNGAKVDDAVPGGTGGLSLEAVSSAIDLTRTNPALESDEQQKLRGGDRFRQYADTAAAVEAFWGLEKA